jgi:hypothetical protein
MQLGPISITFPPTSDAKCDTCAGKAALVVDSQLQCLTCAGERVRSDAAAVGALAVAVLTICEPAEILS